MAYIALVPRSYALETGPPPCCKFPSMRRGCVEKIRHQSCIWQCAARSSAALPPQPHCDENESPRMVGHAALIANAAIFLCWHIFYQARRQFPNSSRHQCGVVAASLAVVVLASLVAVSGSLIMPEKVIYKDALRYFNRSEEHTSDLQSLMRISY